MSDTINIGGIQVSKFYLGGSSDVKIYLGTTKLYPHLQEPCFAVVDNISTYTARTYVDVYETSSDKWYKLNNLSAYEEYGVYGSSTATTYYDGKLVIQDNYEYQYSGSSWVNVGEVSGSTIQTVWYDPSSSGSNARFNIGHYWGENYKMVWNVYIQGVYSSDVLSFWNDDNLSPIEFHLYSNGYYYDMHNPTSTSSPSVYSGDYSYRILQMRAFQNYENSQIMNFTFTYGSFKAELEDGTTIISTGSTRTGFSWYNGLYTPYIQSESATKIHVSRIQVYNANDVLVNDLKFVKNNATGSQELSMYDSVLNVTYNNTTSNIPTYHIVEDSGGTEYPIYYDDIQDPPNNLSFSSMTEAEDYQCPWVGMKATIDGDRYIFSGDSQSGYEWIYQTGKTEDFTILDIGESALTSSLNDGDYVVISFKNHNNPREPQYMMSYTSSNNRVSNFSGYTGSNTITDNTIIDAAVWQLEATTTANTYYIKNVENGLYWGYQNNSTSNSFSLVNSSQKSPILLDDYQGCIGLIEQIYQASTYFGGYGLNQLYGYTYLLNWLNNASSSESDFYTSDGNALFVLYKCN